MYLKFNLDVSITMEGTPRVSNIIGKKSIMASSSSSYAATAIQRQLPDTKPFWKFNTNEISNWIRQLTPGIPNTGGILFPKPLSLSTTFINENEKIAKENEYRTKLILGNTLVGNLTRSLSVASSSSSPSSQQPTPTNVGSSSAQQPILKKPKIEPNSNSNNIGDVYNILDPTFAKSNSGTSSTELVPGAILSRLTLGGLVNGLSGVNGGVVDTLTCIPLDELLQTTTTDDIIVDEATRREERKKRMDAIIETAGNISLNEVIRLARGLHRSIAAR